MKIKHLLIGMLAVAAAVACKQDEPVETPKLDVDKEAVAVAAVAGEASFNVTSNQSWVASADQDWVSITPARGDASEKAVAVKVTAEDNETTDARTATVTVKAGELTKTVKVTQAAGENTDTPTPPEPSGETYILVGEAVGGWNVDENGVVTATGNGVGEVRITVISPESNNYNSVEKYVDLKVTGNMSFSKQPENLKIRLDNDVTFTVETEGFVTNYQWTSLF